jgi:hypothetical protein
LNALDSEYTGTRVTRILTNDFPQYFALISRVRQQVHAIGPEGGILADEVCPQVQAIFPPGALTKRIKVGIQVQQSSQSSVTLTNHNQLTRHPTNNVNSTNTIRPTPRSDSNGALPSVSGGNRSLSRYLATKPIFKLFFRPDKHSKPNSIKSVVQPLTSGQCKSDKKSASFNRSTNPTLSRKSIAAKQVGRSNTDNPSVFSQSTSTITLDQTTASTVVEVRRSSLPDGINLIGEWFASSCHSAGAVATSTVPPVTFFSSPTLKVDETHVQFMPSVRQSSDTHTNQIELINEIESSNANTFLDTPLIALATIESPLMDNHRSAINLQPQFESIDSPCQSHLTSFAKAQSGSEITSGQRRPSSAAGSLSYSVRTSSRNQEPSNINIFRRFRAFRRELVRRFYYWRQPVIILPNQLNDRMSTAESQLSLQPPNYTPPPPPPQSNDQEDEDDRLRSLFASFVSPSPVPSRTRAPIFTNIKPSSSHSSLSEISSGPPVIIIQEPITEICSQHSQPIKIESKEIDQSEATRGRMHRLWSSVKESDRWPRLDFLRARRPNRVYYQKAWEAHQVRMPKRHNCNRWCRLKGCRPWANWRHRLGQLFQGDTEHSQTIRRETRFRRFLISARLIDRNHHNRSDFRSIDSAVSKAAQSKVKKSKKDRNDKSIVIANHVLSIFTPEVIVHNPIESNANRIDSNRLKGVRSQGQLSIVSNWSKVATCGSFDTYESKLNELSEGSSEKAIFTLEEAEEECQQSEDKAIIDVSDRLRSYRSPNRCIEVDPEQSRTAKGDSDRLSNRQRRHWWHRWWLGGGSMKVNRVRSRPKVDDGPTVAPMNEAFAIEEREKGVAKQQQCAPVSCHNSTPTAQPQATSSASSSTATTIPALVVRTEEERTKKEEKEKNADNGDRSDTIATDVNFEASTNLNSNASLSRITFAETESSHLSWPITVLDDPVAVTCQSSDSSPHKSSQTTFSVQPTFCCPFSSTESESIVVSPSTHSSDTIVTKMGNNNKRRNRAQRTQSKSGKNGTAAASSAGNGTSTAVKQNGANGSVANTKPVATAVTVKEPQQQTDVALEVKATGTAATTTSKVEPVAVKTNGNNGTAPKSGSVAGNKGKAQPNQPNNGKTNVTKKGSQTVKATKGKPDVKTESPIVKPDKVNKDVKEVQEEQVKVAAPTVTTEAPIVKSTEEKAEEADKAQSTKDEQPEVIKSETPDLPKKKEKKRLPVQRRFSARQQNIRNGWLSDLVGFALPSLDTITRL